MKQSRFLHGQTDIQLLKKNVPIVIYDNIKLYIHRIANEEALNILLVQLGFEFYRWFEFLESVLQVFGFLPEPALFDSYAVVEQSRKRLKLNPIFYLSLFKG